MKKTFKWLNIAQFTGAFNDNAFKMTAAIALVGILGKGSLPTVLAICSILFVVPFLLFSNYAGTLADRFSKRDIIVATKWMEIGILALAIPTLLSRLAWPLYLLLFLLCTQSALFGPAKRGIVPELVKEDELSKANGFLTAATYSAAILGTAMPSLLIGYAHLHPLYAVGCSFLLALVGTFAARRIAHVPAFGTRTKSSPWIIPDVARALKNLKDDPWSRRAIWGLVLLGGIMAFFQQALIYFGQDALHLSIEKSPMLFPLAAIGIGIGALLTGHFSKHTIEVGLIPVGAISVVIGSLGLSLAAAPFWVEFWIVGIGASCGMYLVPINAFLQQRIPKERRGEVFGASSFLSFSAMILASSLFYLLTKKAGLSARSCIFTIALITLLPATIACLRLPNHLVRFWLMRLIRRLYKIRFQGLENLPREGGALLICNHTAYADALILQAATQRPVRFLVSRDVFKSWKWCKPLFKLTDCIPIHTSDGPRALVNSLKEARAAMEAGAIVAIFPEGELTKTGSLMKFNKGFEKIARNSGCPIIPAHIDNLWGSIFSYRHGTPRLRLPFKFHYPVSVQFGKPLPSSTTAEEAQRVIAELGAEHATAQSLCPKNTLSHRFLKQARHNWFRPIASDTLGQKTTYGQLLTGSLLLARQLPSDERIGILLPTSIGCVLANLAATLSGKTAVNLNWTASAAALQSAVEQSGLKQVVTSRRFLQKQTLPELSVQWIYLEELLEKPARFRALCSALFASPKRLAGGRTPQPTDTAAIIFSSGTTGTPKGIMLSHANLLSNLDAVQSITQFGKNDSICAILPLFHSFGYLALLWWPLLKGMRVAYHPNPLQTKRVVRLIREEKLTGLLATPTFLQNYLRKASAEDFQTLGTVITGGEKLPAKLAADFEEAFSIRPIEGYGCTELSPVALLGNGQPLPNLAIRIVDPETRTPLPDGEDGLLLVKGPSVMQGYLGQPQKTGEVLRDGWYNTGDIARVDAHGLITLCGRLARFSKIAGEMVPHGAVEEALQQAAESDEPCVAVVGMANLAKGEQLAVCYTDEAGDPATLISRLRKLNLPNLWIPRTANFFRIPELPMLGTGKLDLQTLKTLKTLKTMVES